MKILKLQIIVSLFVVLFVGQVYADATCDECMNEKEKAHTVSLNSSVSEVIKVAEKVLPFTPDDVLEICDSLRTPRKAPQNRDYYDFEWRLLQLAGISDPEDTDDDIIKEKVSSFVNKYHLELECPTATRIFPKGGFYRQLIRNDTKFAIEALLEDYNIDPNIIDSDGCTVLDYVDMIINQYGSSVKTITDQFKSYRELLIKHNAKHANDLGGKC